MQLRDAQWWHVGPISPADGAAAPSKVPPLSSVESPTPIQVLAGQVGEWPVARVIRDGTTFWELWQSGQCKKGKSCPDAHRCGVVINAKDRARGFNRHGASTCTQKAKA